MTAARRAPAPDRRRFPASPASPVDASGDAGPGPRPLDVLHVVSSERFAGIERHVLGLAKGLADRGCRCTVACPPSANRLRVEAAAAGIAVVPEENGEPTSTRPGRAWLSRLANGLAREPPDIVHVHDGVSALAMSRLGLENGPRLVRTQHFVQPASAQRTGWKRGASLVLHRVLNGAMHALVAVSESAAAAVKARREVAPGKLTVIEPGIELPDAAAVAAASARRGRLEHPVVAFVGRLDPEKSVHLLVRAIPFVLADLPSCRFVVAGSGTLEENLRELAGNLGVDGAITWTGEVGDASEVLESAHVFVNPCAAEGFGLATAEAMAYALPVVGVAAAGTAELVEDGVNGLLVEHPQSRALAEAILRLAGDRALAERMGEAARRRAAAAFAADRTAVLTLALYERLVGERVR